MQSAPRSALSTVEVSQSVTAITENCASRCGNFAASGRMAANSATEGDKDRTFEWLERAYRIHSGAMAWQGWPILGQGTLRPSVSRLATPCRSAGVTTRVSILKRAKVEYAFSSPGFPPSC